MNGVGSNWDSFGQLVTVLMFMAMLAYLAPGVVSLSPAGRRWVQIAASSLLGVAILIAVIATLIWFAT
jgi:hypothetical protein